MKTGLILMVTMVCTSVCYSDPEPDSRRTFELTLGEKHTVFDGPLLPDGRIDYIAAINERNAKVVPNRDNAMRALLLLLDQEVLSDIAREQFQAYCQVLGVSDRELANSPKLASWYEYAGRLGIDFDVAMQIDEQVHQGVFSHRQVDVFRKWLIEQRPAIDAAVSACMLPAYWQPVVESSEYPGSGLIELTPLNRAIRVMARGIRYRALAAIDEGDLALAAKCAIALRRLASHQQGPFVIHVFVSELFRYQADDLFRRIVDHDLARPKLLDYITREWLQTPLPKRYHEIVMTGEVIYALNLHMAIAANKVSLADDSWFLELDDSSALEDAIDQVGVDLDALVRRTHDAMRSEASRLDADTYVEYQEQAQVYEEAWRVERESIRERFLIEEGGIVRTRMPNQPMSSVELGRLIAELSLVLESELDFDMDIGRAEFTHLVRRVVSDTAAACVRFNVEHGRYPTRLMELVPQYLPAVPVDPIDGKSLRYRVNDDGSAVIYSVYLDQEDDGGLNDPDDFESLDEGDYCWHLPVLNR